MAADGNAADSNTLGINAKAAILIDANTGQVLYSLDADKALPPASMTKLMTEYLVLEAISKNELTWDTKVATSAEAASTPKDGSQIYLAQGDTHTVKELYSAMAIASANDATVALASYLGGTEADFVKKMNDKAQELGLKSAVYTSSTGLLASTVISASDLAKLARIIITTHPEFLEYSSIPSQKFRARDAKPMINNNWMLESNKGIASFKKYVYDGVDGMKTGYIGEAGYCFTGTAKQGDTRFISVIMNTKFKGDRFLETAKLYNYGFQTLEKKTVVEAKSAVNTLETVKISKGVKTSLPLITDEDFSVRVKKGSTPVTTLVRSSLPGNGELVAPIKHSQKIGTATFQFKDEESGQVTEKTINLIASDNVEKAGWLTLMFRGIGDFFGGLFHGIVNLF